jgi:hypothetical protein
MQLIDNKLYISVFLHEIVKFFSGWNNQTRQFAVVTRLTHRPSPASDRGALATACG